MNSWKRRAGYALLVFPICLCLLAHVYVSTHTMLIKVVSFIHFNNYLCLLVIIVIVYFEQFGLCLADHCQLWVAEGPQGGPLDQVCW